MPLHRVFVLFTLLTLSPGPSAQGAQPPRRAPPLRLMAPETLSASPHGRDGIRLALSEKERQVMVEAQTKSVALAWALSFFISLGSGNFYAGAWQNGLGVVITEAVGVGTIFIFWPIATVVLVATWLADWIMAIYATREHNNTIRYRYQDGAPAAEKSLPPPSWALTLR